MRVSRLVPDWYVTETGEVWSLKEKTVKQNGGKPFKMKLMKDWCGHLFVCAYRGKRFFVHRLVALEYLPNPNNLPFVLHKDDNKENNHISNLYWGTVADNTKDSIRNGTWRNPKTGLPHNL